MQEFINIFADLWTNNQKRIPPLRLQNIKEIMQRTSMVENTKQKGFLKKFGKLAPILGGLWIASHIAVPLLLLRIPAAQKYLIALQNKLPFHIPGIV